MALFCIYKNLSLLFPENVNAKKKKLSLASLSKYDDLRT